MKVQRKGKYVYRPLLKDVTHIFKCPNKCDRKSEDKIYWKKSKRKKGFILDWYCPVCGSKLNKVKVTPRIRQRTIVKVLAADYDAKKNAKKKA